MDLNSKEALLLHRNKIKNKGFLKKIYLDFYDLFKKSDFIEGDVVEIGSGGGFIKDVVPSIITSDVISGSGIDYVFFADKMPFKKNSISGFVMLDVLHHIKDPEKAFIEMNRCLKKGGKIIMIEPYISLWGTFIYRHFHSERRGFSLKRSWRINGKGRMSDANPATAWIIFVRDKKLFERKFPNLKIIRVEPHTPFSYLISGGLSIMQLLPTFLYELVRFIERQLSFLNPYIGMFVTVEVEKIR